MDPRRHPCRRCYLDPCPCSESCSPLESVESPKRGSTPVANQRPENRPNEGPRRTRNNGPAHGKGTAVVNSPEKVAFPSALSATGGVLRIACGWFTSSLPGLQTSVPST